MPYTRQELKYYLDPNVPPLVPKMGMSQKYMTFDIPTQFFPIQDWCYEQGSNPYFPSLYGPLQGVIGLLVLGNLDPRLDYSSDALEYQVCSSLLSLDRPDDFKGGVLKQYPELGSMLLSALNELPKGADVISVIRATGKYEFLFKK